MLTFLAEDLPAALDEIIAVCEIPAPSFDERPRAEHVAKRMREIGLAEAYVDDCNNAIGRYTGQESRARLAVCAHIDTVFPAGVDVEVRREGDRLVAPGVGDNLTSVGGMLRIIAAWRHVDYLPSFDILFVGTAGEEGLGDLMGVRGSLMAMDSGTTWILVR